MRQIKVKPISENFSKMMGGGQVAHTRTSITQESNVGEFFYINEENIIPYKNQARIIFKPEEIKNLADSISVHGIRQPLTVIPSADSPSKFEVISGERRLRAARLIGLEKIPCIILNQDDHADEIALVENIQREDLHPLELARSLRKIFDNNQSWTQAELSTRLGLPRTKISELLSLLELPESVQEKALEANCRGRDNLRKLLSLEEESDQLAFLNRCDPKQLELSKAVLRRGSIIRVYLDDDMLKVQKKSVAKLTPEKREHLREILSEIIRDL